MTHPFHRPVDRGSGLSLGLAVLLTVNSCTQSNDEPAKAPSEPTRLRFDLPSAVQISVDGGPYRPPPALPLEVSAGPHSVDLRAKCQELRLDVEASVGKTATVDHEAVPELTVVTLEVTTQDHEGNAVGHSVSLDDVIVGTGNPRSTITVPGCEYRVKVAHTGELGGFIEDIDFGRQERVTRSVVLAPGPDMVRIRGARFTPGTAPDLLETYFDHCYTSKPVAVDIETFDIDRTEVTTEQYFACRRAGECMARLEWSYTRKPSFERYRCNLSGSRNNKEIRPDRAHLPMNCIAQWEAEDYCRWAGKRLVFDHEWEFAARSRNQSYQTSWGDTNIPCVNKTYNKNGEESCRYTMEEPPPPLEPCAFPLTNTEQGVCDMMGNLGEIVAFANFPGRDMTAYEAIGPGHDPSFRQYTMGSSGFSNNICGTFIDGDWSPYNQFFGEGFRCARSVEPRDNVREHRR
ncbi:MAG: formylglycine-generating enzyme family protein [Myxococcales bacterium]|nr:formylglycine-generating enzyme family protein [Myxococcales bacterium]